MSLNKNLELAILLDNISVLNSLTYIFYRGYYIEYYLSTKIIFLSFNFDQKKIYELIINLINKIINRIYLNPREKRKSK